MLRKCVIYPVCFSTCNFVIKAHWHLHCICLYHFIHTVTLLHVAVLKGPSSGSSDTFCVQGQLNTCSDINIPEDGPFKVETCTSVIVIIKWYWHILMQ